MPYFERTYGPLKVSGWNQSVEKLVINALKTGCEHMGDQLDLVHLFPDEIIELDNGEGRPHLLLRNTGDQSVHVQVCMWCMEVRCVRRL